MSLEEIAAQAADEAFQTWYGSATAADKDAYLGVRSDPETQAAAHDARNRVLDILAKTLPGREFRPADRPQSDPGPLRRSFPSWEVSWCTPGVEHALAFTATWAWDNFGKPARLVIAYNLFPDDDTVPEREYVSDGPADTALDRFTDAILPAIRSEMREHPSTPRGPG